MSRPEARFVVVRVEGDRIEMVSTVAETWSAAHAQVRALNEGLMYRAPSHHDLFELVPAPIVDTLHMMP